MNMVGNRIFSCIEIDRKGKGKRLQEKKNLECSSRRIERFFFFKKMNLIKPLHMPPSSFTSIKELA